MLALGRHPSRQAVALVSISARFSRTAPSCKAYTETSFSIRPNPSNKAPCHVRIESRARLHSGLLLIERSLASTLSVSLTRPTLSPSMSQQRSSSTSTSESESARNTDKSTQSAGHSHTPVHDHSHSHSIFHSHSHDDHDHTHGAQQIVDVLEGKGDRGSRITLLGLFVNVGLTFAKGVAGWYMHSVSLLADAGHSLSDLLGDFVTLFCWKLSRKPPSEGYPYGFAKFETLGTTTVSILLIGGALGIGFHSYHLLLEALSGTVSTLPPGPVQDILQHVSSIGHHVPSGHVHAHVDVLDPNAAWFAAVSVLIKEWLYRVTKKVADEEHSPVLYANAVHHRSDAYSSFVALFAILGSSIFPSMPLDPLGGLIVSCVILQQGVGLLGGAFSELTDAGVSKRSQDALLHALDPLLHRAAATSGDASATATQGGSRVLAVKELRAKRAGSLIHVDVTVDVSSAMTIMAASELEGEITRLLRDVRSEVSEVRVKFYPAEGNSS